MHYHMRLHRLLLAQCRPSLLSSHHTAQHTSFGWHNYCTAFTVQHRCTARDDGAINADAPQDAPPPPLQPALYLVATPIGAWTALCMQPHHCLFVFHDRCLYCLHNVCTAVQQFVSQIPPPCESPPTIIPQATWMTYHHVHFPYYVMLMWFLQRIRATPANCLLDTG